MLRAGIAIAVVVAAAVGGLLVLDGSRYSDPVERSKGWMGVELPLSAEHMYEAGSASSPLLRATGLDRTRAVAFVADSADIEAFLDQFVGLEPIAWPSSSGPALSDGLVAADIKWLTEASDVSGYSSTTGALAEANTTLVYLYTLDATSTGVWVHSDWG